MSTESQARSQAVEDYPIAQPPPPRNGTIAATATSVGTATPLPDPVALPQSGNGTATSAPSVARRAVPVAKPAPPRPKLGNQPDEDEEELLPPSALKGWATSIIMHAFLLLILAVWYFAPIHRSDKVIDTRMAGSEFGDESGDSLKGGLGMDTPLAMPEVASGPALETPTITSLPAAELQLDPSALNKSSPTGASNGGGVNLSNPGMGGAGDGFGVAKFGHGGERINDVEVKVGDPQFTLIWDSRADLDLHVMEPGGSHIYWEDRNGTQGGELDVDDIDGFGPENINWVQGQGPPGVYRWYIHYYGGLGGSAVATRWKMRLKHDGKVTVFQGKLNFIGEKSRTHEFTVTADKAAPAPEKAADKK
jgi:hypothetical protein